MEKDIDPYKSFIDLVEKSMLLDPWVIDNKSEGYIKGIKDETDEALLAIKNKDLDNLKEEMGDIFYDWVHACACAEHEGLFSIKDVRQSAHQNLLRRKPFVELGQKVSKEEAVRLWKEAKRLEKQIRSNSKED